MSQNSVSIFCHIFGIGSNIRPRGNFPLIIEALLSLGNKLALSRIIETEPVGFRSRHRFLNTAAALWTHSPAPEIKRSCIRIEERLGRNRSDPDRKYRDRPADIDLLFTLSAGERTVPAEILPQEAYLRAPVLELLQYLRVQLPAPVPALPRGVPISVGGVLLGEAPATIYRDRHTGEIVVVQDGA